MALINRRKEPLSVLARDEILRMLENKEYLPGDMLPSLEEFCKKIGVSRTTLREALKMLEKDGVVTLKQGVGTYVSKGWVFLKDSLNTLRSSSEMLRSFGFEKESNSKVINQEIVVSEFLSKKLNITAGEGIFKLERIRYAKQHPVIYSIDFLPVKLVGKNFDFRATKQQSLYVYLESMGEKPQYAHTTVSAVDAEELPPQVRSEFNTKIFLLLEQQSFNSDNKIIDYSLDHYSSEYFKFDVLRT
jgi:GntR family transcriptional regulator